MPRTSNARCRWFVTNKIEFTANNIFAKKFANGDYAVWSYGAHFPIYVYARNRWFGNFEKYSRSTAKHQSQARPSVSSIIYLPTIALKRLILDPSFMNEDIF